MTDEYTYIWWNIYIVEYYSAIIRNEMLISVTTWINLENIVLNEGSQLHKATCCTISFAKCLE